MILRKHALAVVLGLLPTAAAADLFQCSFSLECLDAEPCAETSFEMEVLETDESFAFSSVNGDRTGPAGDMEGDQRVFVAPLVQGSTQMLTIFPDGGARFTDHTFFGEPFAITYHGTCEAQP